MAYIEGDVLLAYVPYEDGTGVKDRPVVVLKSITEKSRYVIAECYSDKDHYGKYFGILVKAGTELHTQMGLSIDTFITSSIKAIFETNVIRKLGTYPNIHQLKQRLKTT